MNKLSAGFPYHFSKCNTHTHFVLMDKNFFPNRKCLEKITSVARIISVERIISLLLLGITVLDQHM